MAQEDTKDDIPDWRIRVTVNGDDFVLDQWEPLYLKGFKPGKNWVKLEYIDENGNPLNNVFSNTARLINWEPQGQDGLSRIVRGEVSLEEARAIADPTYTYTPPPEPIAAPDPEPVAVPSPEPKSVPVVPPALDRVPGIMPAPVMAPEPAPKAMPGKIFQDVAPAPSPSPSPVESPAAIAPKPKAAKRPSLLRPKAQPKSVTPEPNVEKKIAPNQPEKEIPEEEASKNQTLTKEPMAAPVKEIQPAAKPKSVPTELGPPSKSSGEAAGEAIVPSESPESPTSQKAKFKKPEFFNRFQRTAPSESVKPDLVKPDLVKPDPVQKPVQPEPITPPDPIEVPSNSNPTPALSRFQKRFQPSPSSEKVEAAPIEKPALPSQPSKLDGLMQRFRQKAAELQEKAAQLQEKAATVKVPTLQELQQRNRQPDLPLGETTPSGDETAEIPQSL